MTLVQSSEHLMEFRSNYPTRPVTSGKKKRLARAIATRIVHGIQHATPSRISKAINSTLAEDSVLNEGASRSGAGAIEGRMLHSFEIAPPNEGARVAKLVQGFSKAKKDQEQLIGPYAPGAQWKAFLGSEWASFHSAMDRNDLPCMAAFLRNFFRNEGLTGFWGDVRMFEKFSDLDGAASVRRANLMQKQFDVWREALPDAPVSDLEAPPIGNPYGYVIDGHLLYEPVCEYHFQADYFANLLSEMADPVIMEIGGGFGGLAYQILKKIPRTTYIAFDLPESLLLQAYYLSTAFPDLKILTYDDAPIFITEDVIRAYDVILLPNFRLPDLSSRCADLVVNVRSLSEMPVETFTEYLAQVDRIGRMFFFHENIFQPRRDGIYGIPCFEFPILSNFIRVAASESRWPRYNRHSVYPCQENLFIHRNNISR